MSKSVMHSIFEELIEIPKTKYDELSKFVYDSPHAWMAINMNSGDIFKQFDRVILDEDEEEKSHADI